MKKFIMGMMFVSFASMAIADTSDTREISCRLTIDGNETDRKIDELEQSEDFLTLQLNDGATLSGSIKLQELILDPGTSDQSDNDIIVFKKDEQYKSLKAFKEKKYDLMIRPVDSINYVVERAGAGIAMKISGDRTQELTIDLENDVRTKPIFWNTHNRLLTIICMSSEKSVNTERYKRELEIKKHLEMNKNKASKQ